MQNRDDPTSREPHDTSLHERLRALSAALIRLVELARPAAHPRTRSVTRAGWRTVRAVPGAMRWRSQARAAAPHARDLVERLRADLGVLFAVLGMRSPAPNAAQPNTIADLSWKPNVPAHARIIANPMSGSIRGTYAAHELRETAHWLTARGLPTELTFTESAGHAGELARECVQAGTQMVIAAGGDGTINDVVQGLAGSAVALGVLPLGTVNVWARELGIPLGLADARELLLRGVRRRVDLGRAGSRYFLMMAGVGVDAETVRRVEGNWLRRWGLKLLDYILTAGMLGLTQQPARLWYTMGGKRRATRALMVVMGNTRLHAGALVFAHKAVADDGQLDMVIIGGGGLGHRLYVLTRALLRRPSQTPRVRYDRCQSVRLESAPPLPVQVDGELIGRLPMTFSVAADTLSVIVPHGAPGHLFSRPALRA